MVIVKKIVYLLINRIIGAYVTGTYVESNPAEQGNVTLVLIANGKYVGHYTNSDGQSGDWTDTANAVHQSSNFLIFIFNFFIIFL